MVAYANATSSAALAAVHPESGGAYAYGRHRLGPFWGFMAGWAFLAGKLASCAAMALTFGGYLAPGLARPVALGGLVAVTVANYLGVAKTAAATGSWSRFCWLAAAAVAGCAGGQPTCHRPGRPGRGYGVLRRPWAVLASPATPGGDPGRGGGRPARTIPGRAVSLVSCWRVYAVV